LRPAGHIVIFILAILPACAQAQSPREQLTQMVEQLRKTPGDNVLRERIIKLAQGIKPAPAVPEEARRPFVRGNAAMSEAKTPDDYGRAAQLYEEALALAPWWADPYFNLAKARELRREYDGAIRSLRFYLLAGVAASEAREAQDRIYVLEEKASAGQREKERPQAQVQQLQSKYGNRRLTAHLSCWIPDGRAYLTCSESEGQGSTWTPGARPGSYSWMPIQTRAGSTDFTSLNIRYEFKLDRSDQNQIILGWMDDGSNWLCGTMNGAEAKDVKWRDCKQGFPVELRFVTDPNGRPALEMIKGCDAARNCTRDRWVLE
jgi:hypothetical protein